MLKELETIGLIDMVKQTGVANVIYVKNFVSEDKSSARKTPVKEIHQNTIDTTSEADLPEDNFRQGNLEDRTGEESTTVLGELLHPNNKDTKINMSNTYPISQSYQQIDEVDQTSAYMELIRENH